MTRVRSRTDEGIRPRTYESSVPGGPFDLPFSDFTVYSSITDAGKRPKSKASWSYPTRVRHVRVKRTPLRSRNEFLQNPYGWVSNPSHGWGDGYTPATIIGLSPEVSGSELYDLGQAAFLKLSEQMPTEVSLANFAIEGGEFESMIASFGDNIRRWRRIQSERIGVSDGGYLLEPRSGRDPLDDARNQFLNWNFNISPLIGDLEKLVSIHKKVMERIAWLRKTRGKETRLAFQRKTSLHEAVLPQPVLDLPPTEWNWGSRAYVVHAESLFRAHTVLYHELDDLDNVYGVLRGYFAALGFNNPLGIAWEATRLSFIADWFTGLGTQLRKLALKPFTGEWVCRQWNWSTKTVVRLRFQDKSPSAWTYTPYDWRDVDEFEVTTYFRDGGLPLNPSIFSLDSLSPKQLALLVALLQR